MKKLITSVLLCLWAAVLAAQDGSYFLTHHSPAEQNYDNVCFDIAQDKNGIMYFAVKAGILEYDGREWDLIPGAGAVYALNRNESAIRRSSTPLCCVPIRSPGPRSFRSVSAISNPLFVLTIVSMRAFESLPSL